MSPALRPDLGRSLQSDGMTGRKVRRLWPLLAAPLLLGGCAAPYPPPGGWPNLANAPYYPPTPGQFIPRPELYDARPSLPPDWAVPTSPPEPEPFDEPKQAAVIPAPELKPAAKPIEVIAPKPERQPDPPAPVKPEIVRLRPAEQRPVEPPAEDDCTGRWWSVCHWL
jgi:hypothetical protein